MRRDTRDLLEGAMASRRFPRDGRAEIAFYGGTFTGLPKRLQQSLLETARTFVRPGGYRTIRVSTRPDALDADRLAMLQQYGVETVELGAQSLDDRVLGAVRRGHTAAQVVKAVGQLRKGGFRVGLQLMPGLPGDSAETFQETVRQAVELRPHVVRLYPALALRGTEMGVWFQEGRYRPWTLDRAVQQCAQACGRLESTGIRVIRMGLMSSPHLEMPGAILGGPYHPAFGFLVRARMYRRRMAALLDSGVPPGPVRLFAPAREIPLLRGFANQGLRWFEARTGARVAAVEADPALPPGRIRLEVL